MQEDVDLKDFLQERIVEIKQQINDSLKMEPFPKTIRNLRDVLKTNQQIYRAIMEYKIKGDREDQEYIQ